MLKSRTISIFLSIALITSFLGLTANAQSAPSLSNESADIITSRNVNLNTFVNPNGSNTDICFKYGTSSNSLTRSRCYYGANGTSSIKILIGLINLNEGTTYYYQAVAQNAGGSVSGNVLSFITPGNSGSSTGSNTTSGSNSSNSGQTINSNYSSNSGSSGAPLSPSVATNGPASVNSSSAVINGSVNPNNAYTTFWFDFGTSPSLGQKTSVQPVGIGNTWELVTGNLSGLITGATYYYRLAAQNSQGTNWGEIKTFVVVNSNGSSGFGNGGQVLGSTSGNATGLGSTNSSNSTLVKTNSATKTVPISNPTKDRPSFVSLEYSLGNDEALVVVADNIRPKPGEEFSHTLVYKNNTNSSFYEANLKIILPSEVDYVGASQEPSSMSTTVIQFNLGEIPSGAEGSIVVIVKIKETVQPGTNIIFTSVLGYKDSKGTQLASTSYLTVKVGENSASLSTASLGSFVGMSGILWLIGLVLLIVMGLLTFRFVKMKRSVSSKEDDIFGTGNVPPTFEPIGQIGANPIKR